MHLPFTLFCVCCFTHSTKKQLCCLLVTLWRLTQFFYQSFTFLFLAFFLSLKKMAKYLILPTSQLYFFLVINSPPSWQLKSICALCLYFHPHSFFHSPSWQLKAHLAPVSVVDIPSGCWLDRPVTTLLAKETDINISPLCCPYSSVEEHDWAGGAGGRVGSWVGRWKGEESKEKKEKKIIGGACHLSVCAVWFTSLLDFRLTWITAP